MPSVKLRVECIKKRWRGESLASRFISGLITFLVPFKCTTIYEAIQFNNFYFEREGGKGGLLLGELERRDGELLGWKTAREEQEEVEKSIKNTETTERNAASMPK